MTDMWVTRPRPNGAARLRLFCFPAAGGNASTFAHWGSRLRDLEVCPIELPGRGRRLSEPLLTRLEPLVDGASRALLPWLDKPFGLFGHSMGALLAFEVARRLREQGLVPARLCVAASSAPHLLARDAADAPIHTLSDDAFAGALRGFRGTPQAVLEHPEMLRLVAPIVRADFTVLETYAYEEALPLGCPISAFGGVADAHVHRRQLEGWRNHTAVSFTLQMLPGDHFFIKEASGLLLVRLADELTPRLEVRA
jgi:surfactin synthase thioesterase subunit